MARKSSVRDRRLRRSLLLGGASLGSLAVLAPVAEAASNFGGEYTNATVFGGRSSITTPSSADAEIVDQGEFTVHRVAAQGYETNGVWVGLIQTGLYRSGPFLRIDNCDNSVDTYSYYVEILPADNTQTYKCALYGTAPFGHDNEYKVSGDGSRNWQAAGADVQAGTTYSTSWVPLKFRAGTNYISTELQSGYYYQAADRSTTSVLYGGGAAADPGWYAYQQPGYGSPHRVQASDTSEIPHTNPGATGPTGTWYVPDAPTPSRYKHVP